MGADDWILADDMLLSLVELVKIMINKKVDEQKTG
jgi:hypothetical protein